MEIDRLHFLLAFPLQDVGVHMRFGLVLQITPMYLLLIDDSMERIIHLSIYVHALSTSRSWNVH